MLGLRDLVILEDDSPRAKIGNRGLDIRNGEGHLGVRTGRSAAGLGDREQRAFAGSVENRSRALGKRYKPERPFIEDPKTLGVRCRERGVYTSIAQHISASRA